MKTIEYGPDEEAIADAHCERRARDFLLLEGQQHICVGSENFIAAARALIAEGIVPHTEVEFVFAGQVLQPDRGGRLQHWPRGFCDTMDGFCMRILGMQAKHAENRVKPKG